MQSHCLLERRHFSAFRPNAYFIFSYEMCKYHSTIFPLSLHSRIRRPREAIFNELMRLKRCPLGALVLWKVPSRNYFISYF